MKNADFDSLHGRETPEKRRRRYWSGPKLQQCKILDKIVIMSRKYLYKIGTSPLRVSAPMLRLAL